MIEPTELTREKSTILLKLFKIITCTYKFLLMFKIIICTCKILLMFKIITCTYKNEKRNLLFIK